MNASVYVLAGLASVVFIFARAFQQLNVMHHEWKWVIPTSLVMAMCEVTVVSAIVKATDPLMVAVLGISGGAGAIVSMFTHKSLRERKAKANDIKHTEKV